MGSFIYMMPETSDMTLYNILEKGLKKVIESP